MIRRLAWMQTLLTPLKLRGLGGDLMTSLVAQGGAALLGLALVKLSVSLYPASAYGLASLVLGLQSLLRNILLQPFLQYFILHYWDLDHPKELAHQASRAVDLFCLLSLPLVFIAGLAIGLGLRSAGLATLLVGVFAWMEGRKSLRLLPLHLHQAQARYGMYTLLDSAAKPFLVLLAVSLWGSAPLGLVGAHLVGGSLVFLVIPWDRKLQALQGPELDRRLPPLRRHVSFLWPIAIVGVAAWITGLSDRYVVARTLGFASAGHYAALYGLFTAPFTIYVTAVTNVLRPRLQHLILDSEPSLYLRKFRIGLLGFALGVCGLALLLFALRLPLLAYLLRAEYRPALPALPGILLGQICMATGLFLEVDLYLKKRTSWVMAKQVTGAIVGLIAIPALIYWKGMAGAGIACIAYYGADLSMGIILHFRGLRPVQGSRTDAAS